jgi:hypothetical protein
VLKIEQKMIERQYEKYAQYENQETALVRVVKEIIKMIPIRH